MFLYNVNVNFWFSNWNYIEFDLKCFWSAIGFLNQDVKWWEYYGKICIHQHHSFRNIEFNFVFEIKIYVEHHKFSNTTIHREQIIEHESILTKFWNTLHNSSVHIDFWNGKTYWNIKHWNANFLQSFKLMLLQQQLIHHNARIKR